MKKVNTMPRISRRQYKKIILNQRYKEELEPYIHLIGELEQIERNIEKSKHPAIRQIEMKKKNQLAEEIHNLKLDGKTRYKMLDAERCYRAEKEEKRQFVKRKI